MLNKSDLVVMNNGLDSAKQLENCKEKNRKRKHQKSCNARVTFHKKTNPVTKDNRLKDVHLSTNCKEADNLNCEESALSPGSGVSKDTQKNKKVIVRSEDISSNWKKLCATLPKTIPRKRLHTNVKRMDKKDEIWFDDVDEILIDDVNVTKSNPSKHLVKPKSFEGLTRTVAMDCEMVGVGMDGKNSIVARVSLVNQFGNCIYDKFVKPTEDVTDYRTSVSGVRPHDVANGEDFKLVQTEVSEILKERILVGHSLAHDLKVLHLSHARRYTRDTTTYKKFRQMFGGRTPALRKLSERFLGVTIQDGEHSSVQDAQAAMRLYTMNKIEWESSLKQRKHRTDKANN